MGTLVYNGGVSLAVDDRTMAHLQVVIINKLRRRESFTFTWDDGSQQVVCWLGPSVPIEFIYSGNRRPALNRAWLELLALSANANAGLVVMPEPPEAPEPLRAAESGEPVEPADGRRSVPINA